MNICIIGDSHTAALKRSWNEIAPLYPNISLTFFASRGVTMSNLKVRGHSLVPHKEYIRKQMLLTSNGRSEIKQEDYDIFLLYGLKCETCFIGEDSFYSEQLLQHLVSDISENTASSQVLRKLRKVTQKKIWLGHTPLEASIGSISLFEPKEYIGGINILNKRFYRQFNAQLVQQPVMTIVNGRYTDEKFTSGSKRLDIGDVIESEYHAPEDREHMNDEFGKLWLQNFFEILTQHEMK